MLLRVVASVRLGCVAWQEGLTLECGSMAGDNVRSAVDIAARLVTGLQLLGGGVRVGADLRLVGCRWLLMRIELVLLHHHLHKIINT